MVGDETKVILSSFGIPRVMFLAYNIGSMLAERATRSVASIGEGDEGTI